MEVWKETPAFQEYVQFIETIESSWEYQEPLTPHDILQKTNRLKHILTEITSVLFHVVSEKRRDQHYSLPEDIQTFFDSLHEMPDIIKGMVMPVSIDKIALSQSLSFCDTLNGVDFDLFHLLKTCPLDLVEQVREKIANRNKLIDSISEKGAA